MRQSSPIQSSTSSQQQSKAYVSPNQKGNERSRSQSPVPITFQSRPPQPIFKDGNKNYNSVTQQPVLGQPLQNVSNYQFYQQQQASQVGSNNSRYSANQSIQSQSAAAYIYIPCPSHPDLFITNICKTPDCVEPLCPECITAHLDMHTTKGGAFAKIENIQRVRKECIQNLYNQIDRLSKESNELRSHGLGSQQTHYQTCVDQIRVQHQRMLDMVDDYFEYLEKELKESMRGLDQLKKTYQELDNLVIEDSKQLENLVTELQGQKYVSIIIQILENDQNLQAKKKIQELEQAIQKYEESLPMIQSDGNIYEYIRSQMKSLCFITTKQQQQAKASLVPLGRPIFNDPSRIRSNRHQIDSSGKRQPVATYPVDSLPHQNVLSHIPQDKSQVGDQRELNIDTQNHFEEKQDKFIVSFEEDSKKLHLLYLQDQEYKIQTFNLNIDFRIPVNHKQIVTSEGHVLLTGGVYREKNRFKSSQQVYRLDLKEMTLQQAQPMNQARAIHSLCQIQDQIFAVGGTSTNDENTSQQTAEKLDLNTQRWTPVADCKYKTSGCCIAGIENKYLVKIGGKLDIFTPCLAIELYDIQKDLWSDIEYQFSGNGYLRLPFNACVVSIDSQDLLVFGGSVHDVKSNECSLISNVLSKKATITLSRQIPRAIEFPNVCAIVEDNKIWTFEDFGGKKKVLQGSQQGWIEY